MNKIMIALLRFTASFVLLLFINKRNSFALYRRIVFIQYDMKYVLAL